MSSQLKLKLGLWPTLLPLLLWLHMTLKRRQPVMRRLSSLPISMQESLWWWVMAECCFYVHTNRRLIKLGWTGAQDGHPSTFTQRLDGSPGRPPVNFHTAAGREPRTATRQLSHSGWTGAQDGHPSTFTQRLDGSPGRPPVNFHTAARLDGSPGRPPVNFHTAAGREPRTATRQLSHSGSWALWW